MLTSFTIKNYKSIVDLTLELGRFNVFIGENGAGKTNILEALAMAAGAATHRSRNEDLHVRGIRLARASMTTSAFRDREESAVIEIEVQTPSFNAEYELSTTPYGWFQTTDIGDIHNFDLREDAQKRKPLTEHLSDFGIYCANTLALRGLQVESHREPLGLYGEGLDVVIAQLEDPIREQLMEHTRVIEWFDGFDIDREGHRKLQGYKPGRSRSELYFTDRFLREDTRFFSAENANEGILHLLFYLALFLAPNTPRCFAIDNIETALNPHLLRHLVKTLTQLAKDNDRQALVTTHNPATLDGLNLHDDTQRLFVVSRNDDGHTTVRRIQQKPPSPEGTPQLKLSEMWMRGLLGAIPTHF